MFYSKVYLDFLFNSTLKAFLLRYEAYVLWFYLDMRRISKLDIKIGYQWSVQIMSGRSTHDNGRML